MSKPLRASIECKRSDFFEIIGGTVFIIVDIRDFVQMVYLLSLSETAELVLKRGSPESRVLHGDYIFLPFQLAFRIGYQFVKQI